MGQRGRRREIVAHTRTPWGEERSGEERRGMLRFASAERVCKDTRLQRLEREDGDIKREIQL